MKTFCFIIEDYSYFTPAELVYEVAHKLSRAGYRPPSALCSTSFKVRDSRELEARLQRDAQRAGIKSIRRQFDARKRVAFFHVCPRPEDIG